MARPDPRVEPTTEPPEAEAESSVQRVSDEKRDEREKVEPASAPASKVTSADPRYEELEKLADRNDWRGIAESLGSIDEIGKLPPNLGLVAALAHAENAKEASPEAIQAAIRCMAGLLGIGEESPIARVLARRLLRKNPTRLVDRKAPPARVSALIVLVTLVVGGGVGFVMSIGSWRGILNLFHR